MFHCGKMDFFHVVLFIVDVFQLRIIFFRPSKLKAIMDHHNMFFFFFFFLCSYFLHWNYEVHILCYIKDHRKRVYCNILCFHRCFDVMLFFIGNSQ